MFMTPGAAAELARLLSLGGDDDRPWTAESTLESGSVMLIDCYSDYSTVFVL